VNRPAREVGLAGIVDAVALAVLELSTLSSAKHGGVGVTDAVAVMVGVRIVASAVGAA
jgi:hypothetical protein